MLELLAPVTNDRLPAAQLIHTLELVAPDTDEYVPVKQFVHEALPLLDLYDPATQPVQTPPSGPVYPTLHLQTLIPELDTGELLFVGHAEHDTVI
jgi:hypothetical protein